MIDENELEFGKFLHSIETAEFDTNTTATGAVTIQQTPRNQIRRQGLDALKHDLNLMYGEEFDIVETKEGLVLVAENEPGDFTFSWELKSTIKSLDYDPFIEASNYEDDVAAKAAKKEARDAEKVAKQKLLEEKRAKKLAEIEARNSK